MELIVAVAIKTPEGEILVRRHSHSELMVMFPDKFMSAEQGFLTSKNRFVDRKEALKIAKKHNNINKLVDNDELYSEDIFLDEKKELEADLYEANNIISDQIDLLRNSVSKDKIREYKEWYENTAKHLSGNGINLEAYENAVAISKFCNKLLSLEE